MPASGRLLLDTNIVIALLEGDDAVLSNLDQAPEVFIPAIVVGALFFGAPACALGARCQSSGPLWCSSDRLVKTHPGIPLNVSRIIRTLPSERRAYIVR